MIKIKNLTKIFKQINGKELLVLKDINYTFSDKGLYAILGESGSGKTTLLDIIGGIDFPTSGEVFFDENNICSFDDKKRSLYLSEIVSFVFQANNIIETLNVEENILLSLSNKKISRDEVNSKLEEILKILKLTDKRFNKVKYLSGGEKQRVAIGRALIKNSKVILADEPTGSLDEESSLEIMNLLKEISKKHLVILVTHNNNLALKFADKILLLRDKKINEEKINNSNTIDTIDILTTSEKSISKRLSFKNKIKMIVTNFKSRKMKTCIISFALLMITTIISTTCLICDGFNNYLNEINNSTFSKYPISIEPFVTSLDILLNPGSNKNFNNDYKNNPDKIYISETNNILTKNNISSELVRYLKNTDESIKNNLLFNKGYSLDALVKNGMNVSSVKINALGLSDKLFNQQLSYFNVLPENKSVLNEDYSLIKGRLPQNENEAILILNKDSSVSKNYLENFGLSTYLDKKELSPDDFIGLTYKFVSHNDFYTQLSTTKVVDGIFFKREYDLLNDGLDLNSLYQLIDMNLEKLQSLSSIDELIGNPEGISFLKSLYPYLDKEVTYDIDKIDFNNEEHVERLLLSLIVKRNLNCYKEKSQEELNSLYEKESVNEATIVGIYKLNEEKLVSSYSPGLYFDNKILTNAQKVNKPDWEDIDNDGTFSRKDDRRSYILKSYESNFYISYDGTFTLNTPTIFNEIKINSNDVMTYLNNIKSLGLIDYISSISYFPKDKSDKDHFIKIIDEYNKQVESKLDQITLLDISGTSFGVAQEIFNIVVKILIVISILISLISILLIGVILYDFINNEIYNIGIYMSLGIRKSDIRKVNILEGIMMGLFSTTLSSAFTFLFLFIMTKILKPSLNYFGGFTLMNVTPIYVILLLLTSFLVVTLLYFLPIFKINRLTIKDILRK